MEPHVFNISEKEIKHTNLLKFRDEILSGTILLDGASFDSYFRVTRGLITLLNNALFDVETVDLKNKWNMTRYDPIHVETKVPYQDALNSNVNIDVLSALLNSALNVYFNDKIITNITHTTDYIINDNVLSLSKMTKTEYSNGDITTENNSNSEFFYECEKTLTALTNVFGNVVSKAWRQLNYQAITDPYSFDGNTIVMLLNNDKIVFLTSSEWGSFSNV